MQFVLAHAILFWWGVFLLFVQGYIFLKGDCNNLNILLCNFFKKNLETLSKFSYKHLDELYYNWAIQLLVAFSVRLWYAEFFFKSWGIYLYQCKCSYRIIQYPKTTWWKSNDLKLCNKAFIHSFDNIWCKYIPLTCSLGRKGFRWRIQFSNDLVLIFTATSVLISPSDGSDEDFFSSLESISGFWTLRHGDWHRRWTQVRGNCFLLNIDGHKHLMKSLLFLFSDHLLAPILLSRV